MTKAWNPLFAAMAACLTLLSGCLTKEEDRAGGSVVENEVIAGTLLLADGSPAAGAAVKVYPVDHIPGLEPAPKASAAMSPIFSTRTDSKGRYVIDSLPKGEYNILGLGDDLLSYQDSVYLSGTPKNIPTDTLLDAGSASGWIKLQPNHNPETVTLQVLGTHVFANAGEDGGFKLGPLADGVYSLRAVTTEAQYTPLYTSFRVRAGVEGLLPDTLKPVFTGIPVVTGLKVIYDTLAGVATLTWTPVRYAHFQGYQVLRNAASDVVPNPAVLATVEDTVYRDTLFLADTLSGRSPSGVHTDSLIRRMQYRIKVVNRSDISGLHYGKADLDAPSPWFVRTAMDIEVQNRTSGKSVVRNEVSPGDSLRFNLWFRNPTRKIVSVRWLAGAGTSFPDWSAALDSRSGVASFIHVSGAGPGNEAIRVEARDEAGTIWESGLVLKVKEDAPSASAGPDQQVGRSQAVTVRGNGSDSLGRIVKYEWDIGGTGIFAAASPETSFTAPSHFDRIPCILRVTDDDGYIGLDTSWLMVQLQWTKVPVYLDDRFPGHLSGHKTLVFAGKMWNLGGISPNVPAGSKYLPLNSASSDGVNWERMDSIRVFTARSGHGALVFKEKMWVFGGKGHDPDPAKNHPQYGKHVRYDAWSSADGRTWTMETEGSFPGEGGFAMAVFQDRAWTLGGAQNGGVPVGVFHSENGVDWIQASSDAPLPPLEGHSAMVHEGRIYVTGGNDPRNGAMNRDVWSSEDGIRWSKLAQNPAFGALAGHRSLVYDGRLWILGGYDERYMSPDSEISLHVTVRDRIWYSDDGISWQRAGIPDSGFPKVGFSALDFKGGLMVLFGHSGSAFDGYRFMETVWLGK